MKRLNTSGFTLIELMITCVLISIIALSMAAFLTGWLSSYSDANARTSLLSNAENALDIASSDIRLSGSADDANRWPDTNSPSGNYGWQSSGSTLVLAKAATDTQGNIIFSDPNNYITEKDNEVYFVSADNLYRRTITSGNSSDSAKTTCPTASASKSCPADQLVASGVTSFSVQYFDSDENQVSPDNARSVGLAITLEAKDGSKNLTSSYNTRMVFRNE